MVFNLVMITVWKKVIIASKNVGAGLVPLEAFGGLYQQAQWLGLQSIIMVKRVRHLWNKTTCEVQFYLSSLPADAQKIGNAIRKHWGIENQAHWILDVTFN